MSALAFITGAALLCVGFYFYIDTFANSCHFGTDAGLVRLVMSGAAITIGGLVAVFALVGVTP